jgi:hypothetical protein
VGAEFGDLGRGLPPIVFEFDHPVALEAVVIAGAAALGHPRGARALAVILDGLAVGLRAFALLVGSIAGEGCFSVGRVHHETD